jgi:hypothetical protein
VTALSRPARSLWDEVWDEYDMRVAARGPKPATSPAAPPPTPAPPLPVAATAVGKAPPRGLARLLHWPRGWGLRRAGLALTALLGLYLVSPIASAVQFAAAVQRADPDTLAARVDWTQLRPGIEARLQEITATRLRDAPPAFLAEMQQSLADHLASPAGLARALAHHLPPGEGLALRQWLREARPVSAGLWQVSLASPDAPSQVVRLTLRLADPWSLHWSVVGVELPGPLGPVP